MKKSWYPWAVAVLAAVVLAINNGFTFAGITVFDKAIIDELSLAVGALKLRDTYTYLAAAVFAPLMGALADRFGAKPLLILGSALIAVVFFFYGRVQDVATIYGLHALMGFALATGGLMMCVILVSRWFTARRGLALGILVAGSSLGNALLPKLNTALINEHGWREAFVYVAAAPILSVLIVLLLIREPPRPGRSAEATDDHGGCTFREALRTRSYWFTGVIAFTTFFSLMGVTANLMLHMQLDLEVPLERAADTLMILFVTAFVSKLLAGLGSDRIGVKPVLIMGIGLMVLGVALMTLMSTRWVWVGVFALGLGWGGLYTLIQLLPSYLFGTRALGKILGSITVLETLGGATGPFLIGRLYDTSGDYQTAFMIVCVLLVAALISAACLRGRPYRSSDAGAPSFSTH